MRRAVPPASSCRPWLRPRKRGRRPTRRAGGRRFCAPPRTPAPEGGRGRAGAGSLRSWPPPRGEGGGGGSARPQLLFGPGALKERRGFSGRFEIYPATAPLVRATAAPLPAATLQRVRREVAVRWTGDAALAPLLDRDGWDVVGAVAARPVAPTWPISPWSLGALLLFLVAGGQSVGAIGRPRHAWRPTFRPYGIVAAVFGAAVFAGVRGAARDATSR